jgi:hypothetical protein
MWFVLVGLVVLKWPLPPVYRFLLHDLFHSASYGGDRKVWGWMDVILSP